MNASRVGDRIAPLGPFRRGERQRLVEDRVQHVDERHLGDDRAEQVGPHVRDRAHQQAAGRAALRDQLARRRPAMRHQVFGGRDEIVERVRLLGELAVPVPAPALFRAAAHMRDGENESAIDQRQPVGAERRRDRQPIGAVAVEQARRRPVEDQALAVEDGDRHGFAVGGRRQQAPRHIGGRIVAARNLLALAQGPVLRHEVVVPDLGGRRHRRIGEAQEMPVANSYPPSMPSE